MPALTSPYVLPILLLLASNVFMTFAWYVPANRIGYQVYSAAELKTMQEVITFVVFAVFSVVYLKQAITMNHLIGFALIAAGAFFVFRT